MQIPAAPQQSIVGYVLAALAILFGGGAIGSVFTALLNKSVRRAEAVEKMANADKARAEGRHFDGESLDKAWERVDGLMEYIDELRADLVEIRKQKDVEERVSLAKWREIGNCYLQLNMYEDDLAVPKEKRFRQKTREEIATSAGE